MIRRTQVATHPFIYPWIYIHLFVLYDSVPWTSKYNEFMILFYFHKIICCWCKHRSNKFEMWPDRRVHQTWVRMLLLQRVRGDAISQIFLLSRWFCIRQSYSTEMYVTNKTKSHPKDLNVFWFFWSLVHIRHIMIIIVRTICWRRALAVCTKVVGVCVSIIVVFCNLAFTKTLWSLGQELRDAEWKKRGIDYSLNS